MKDAQKLWNRISKIEYQQMFWKECPAAKQYCIEDIAAKQYCIEDTAAKQNI